MKYFIISLLLFFKLGYAQKNPVHEVYFDTGKHEVPETEKNRLLLFIAALDSISIEKIAIYGFCDDRGTNSYNLKLSQQRANKIKSVFSNNGINDSVITNVNGKGEVLLKVLNEKDIHKIRGLNRKVEIIVSPKTPVLKKTEPKQTPKKVTHLDSLKSLKPSIKNLIDGTVKKGDKIRLENIYFKVNYSYITSGSRKTLEQIAKVLKTHNTIYFTIQGHVCCTQNSRDAIDKRTRKRNLSVARAKFIYDYLAKKGISKKRMKYVGLRRRFPLGGDPKYDRRVEILITYVGKKRDVRPAKN